MVLSEDTDSTETLQKVFPSGFILNWETISYITDIVFKTASSVKYICQRETALSLPDSLAISFFLFIFILKIQNIR